MRLFSRRNKVSPQNSNLPPEVKEYYAAGKKQRKGVAWLLAISTLFVTILVVFGAFLGGRWVYRKIANSGKEQTVQTDQTGNDEQGAPADTQQDQPEDTPDSTEVEDAPAPQPAPAPSTSSPPTNTQAGTLPQSGPADTLAVFAVTTVAGTALYQVRLKRRHQD